MADSPTARQRAGLAIPWALGMAITNILFGFSDPWAPILALFLIGGYYGIKSVIT